MKCSHHARRAGRRVSVQTLIANQCARADTAAMHTQDRISVAAAVRAAELAILERHVSSDAPMTPELRARIADVLRWVVEGTPVERGVGPLAPTRAEVAALMKRCQIGVGGRHALDNAHSIMSDCYGTLGAMGAEIERLHDLRRELQTQIAKLQEQCARSGVEARRAERERLRGYFRDALADTGITWPGEVDILYDKCFGTPYAPDEAA